MDQNNRKSAAKENVTFAKNCTDASVLCRALDKYVKHFFFLIFFLSAF